MVTDFLLNPIFGLIDTILSPLSLLSWTLDKIMNIPLLTSFLEVVAYVIPWAYLYPLVVIIFGIIGIKIAISLIKFIKGFIPGLGG